MNPQKHTKKEQQKEASIDSIAETCDSVNKLLCASNVSIPIAIGAMATVLESYIELALIPAVKDRAGVAFLEILRVSLQQITSDMVSNVVKYSNK